MFDPPKTQQKAQWAIVKLGSIKALEGDNHTPGASCKTCCFSTHWRGVTLIEHMIFLDKEW